MAEETQEKGTTAEAKPAPKPAKKALPALPLHLLVPAGAALAAAAIGITAGLLLVGPRVAAMRGAAPAEKPAEAHEEPAAKGKHGGGHGAKEGVKATVFKMDNLIVNPAGSGGTRFLLASVAVEVPDERIEARMRERDFQLRDVVISVLERETLDSISLPGARDSIKLRLSGALNRVVKSETPLRVYLPQFVIQ